MDADAVTKGGVIIDSLVSAGVEVMKIPIPAGRKDVGEMTRREFLECKASAFSIDLDNKFMYRMMMAANSGSNWRK